MSPEIRLNNKLIASVPDETGMYQTLNGKPLYVNVDLIHANANRQLVILDSQEISGLRVVGLTQQGIGNSSRSGGDNKSPEISVSLLDRPIRVSYKPRTWRARLRTYPGPNDEGYYVDTKRTYKNPRWVKGHGQR